MAITNMGYNGQVSAAEMALIHQHAGIVVPVVGGKDDFAVSANNSATLTCTIAPGLAYAPGVRTASSAVESRTFNAVLTAGATRWDAVVLRRTWAGAGASDIVVVQGTASASAPAIIPAGVDLVLDGGLDQMLALVQFTYGSTIPTAVLDRRAWAHPVYSVPSVQALPPAAANLYGMEAIVGTDRYQCLTDTSNNPAWVSSRQSATSVFTSATGWSAGASTMDRDGRSVHLTLVATRTGAAISAGTGSGDIGNVLIGSLNSGIPKPVAATGGVVYGGPLLSAPLTASGQIFLGALIPGYTLTTGTATTLTFSYLTND